MNNSERKQVSFAEQKDAIISKAAAMGDVKDIETWRQAFPDIDFMDVDAGMSGMPIDWSSFTPTEIAAYVAYMVDPEALELRFSMEANFSEVWHALEDSERIWWCWMAHAMHFFDENAELEYKAIDTLFYYLTQPDFYSYLWDEYKDYIDEIEVTEMEFKHKPVV